MNPAEELRKPEFWATHYHELFGDEDHDSGEVVESVFGIPDQQLASYYFSLIRPEAEAVHLSVELFGGYGADVEYVDCGDDGTEVRYFLSRNEWDRRELLGYESPHFALPAFRWTEIDSLGRILERKSLTEAATAVLLLFPAVYLTGAGESAAAETALRRYWEALSLPSRAFQHGAFNNVIDNRTVPNLVWEQDPELGWINNWDYSFRNPKTLMTQFEPIRFRRVRLFVEALERCVSSA